MPPRIDLDLEELRRLIEVQCLQQWLVAVELGVSVATVERACRLLGLRTAKTGPRRGPGHPDWKGGRKLVGGYWYVWAPEHPNATKAGYVSEHRMQMSETLGRPLHRHEVVHHIDGNPQNNDPANLELFQANSEHLKHELAGRTPNWTPEGKARIRATLAQNATRRRGTRRDDPARTRTTVRPPSKL